MEKSEVIKFRSEIRDFRGAMQGRADKGLFITDDEIDKEWFMKI